MWFVMMRLATLRRPLRLVLPLLAVVALLTACTPEQQQTIDLVNQARTQAGLPTLLPHAAAVAKAQAWAEHMAAATKVEHSNLADGMTGDWDLLGENVGAGATIEAVQQAFLASPAHRANILDGRYNWVGTGVAKGADNRVYVVQVFAHYDH